MKKKGKSRQRNVRQGKARARKTRKEHRIQVQLRRDAKNK